MLHRWDDDCVADNRMVRKVHLSRNEVDLWNTTSELASGIWFEGVAEVNSIIELHDTTVDGIDLIGSSCVIRFRPAYIHRSAGRPGFDRGTGWVQDVDLMLENVASQVGFTDFPCDLSDGSYSIDGVVFENEIPFPVDASGNILVSFENQRGEKQIITATRIRTNAVGNATYIEEFPGSI